MAKSTYFSNSARLLAIVSGMLLLANTLVALGSLSDFSELATWGTKFSNFSLYIVLALGFLALNGEGVAHKRARDRKSKKTTDYLKILLFFCFVLRYVKGAPESAILSLDPDSVGGILSRLLMSFVSTIGSYGFLLCAISFWYIIRDKSKKKFVAVEMLSFGAGVFYNGFKLFNYAVDKYDIAIFGEAFSNLFSQSAVLHILCVLQFFLNVVMFILVSLYYGKLGMQEQIVLDQNTRELPSARNVLKEEGFGIDTLEDDFINS